MAWRTFLRLIITWNSTHHFRPEEPGIQRVPGEPPVRAHPPGEVQPGPPGNPAWSLSGRSVPRRQTGRGQRLVQRNFLQRVRQGLQALPIVNQDLRARRPDGGEETLDHVLPLRVVDRPEGGSACVGEPPGRILYAL